MAKTFTRGVDWSTANAKKVYDPHTPGSRRLRRKRPGSRQARRIGGRFLASASTADRTRPAGVFMLRSALALGSGRTDVAERSDKRYRPDAGMGGMAQKPDDGLPCVGTTIRIPTRKVFSLNAAERISLNSARQGTI